MPHPTSSASRTFSPLATPKENHHWPQAQGNTASVVLFSPWGPTAVTSKPAVLNYHRPDDSYLLLELFGQKWSLLDDHNKHKVRVSQTLHHLCLEITAQGALAVDASTRVLSCPVDSESIEGKGRGNLKGYQMRSFSFLETFFISLSNSNFLLLQTAVTNHWKEGMGFVLQVIISLPLKTILNYSSVETQHT